MPHDFAKKKPVKSSRGARRAEKPERKRVSAWAWLSAGLLTGAFICLLVYLTLPVRGDRSPADSVSSESHVVSTLDADQKRNPRFAFYTLLSESEVVVPPAREPASVAAPVATEISELPGYLLQAGSFRATGDADRRRAELLLLGFDARVETVQVAGGQTWHRVQVGPFSSGPQLSSAKERLANERIDSLLITQRN